MPLYEVFIPNENNDGKGRKGQVRADSWTAALKTGLKKVGGSEVDTRSLMCDIKADGRMDVTDPKSGRVFVIRDLDASKDTLPKLRMFKARQSFCPPSCRDSWWLFGETSKIYDHKTLKEASSFVLGWLKERFQVSLARSSSPTSAMTTFSLLRQPVQKPVRL